jgi:predicted nucleotidyltransferase
LTGKAETAYNTYMAQQPANREQKPNTRWYRGADIPLSLIRRFARDVADQFRPDKVILFGSYAYGKPHADSDVDILVVMPARNSLDQAFKIHWKIRPPFPLHILVRTPKSLAWRLAEGESFMTEVLSRGKVLYEANNTRVGAKGRSRSRDRRTKQRKRGSAA